MYVSNIYLYIYVCMYIWVYRFAYVYIERQRDRETERQRESTDKTNRKEVWFDFHMQNLKHLCYVIPNFTFNDK